MIERAKHISSGFDSALYGLRNDVLMMSSLTDRIFQNAFEALLNLIASFAITSLQKIKRSTFLRSRLIRTGSVC
jgi:hypothetical protein